MENSLFKINIRFGCFKQWRVIIPILVLLSIAPRDALSQSFACGIDWSLIQQLSSDSVLSILPQFTVNNRNIHVIWFGIDTLGTMPNDGLQYTKSIDSGKIFLTQRTLVSSNAAFSPGKISSSGSFVYVTFTGLVDGSFGTAFIRSSDDGETWDPPSILLIRTQPYLMAAADSIVLIHYIDQRGGYGLLKSSDHGNRWRTINSTMPLMNDFYFTSNQIHAVSTVDFGQHDEVGYYYSINGGISWIGPDIISPEDLVSSLYPKISIDNDGTRIITWNDDGNIMIRRSDGYDEEDELLWEPTEVVYDGGDAVFSELAVNNNTTFVAWDIHRSDSSTVQIRQSIDGGKSFCESSFPMTTKAGEPTVEIQGQTVHLMWSGEGSIGGEIFYQQGTLLPDTRPKIFSLMQNYPNPVNGITHIEYDITRPCRVSLIL
ncbi:MAG: hypothetical protein HY800_09185, partial [Ignavibacteriales bacterium]|nr:hypothetical protein [Ignavibacteriales bacterium]